MKIALNTDYYSGTGSPRCICTTTTAAATSTSRRFTERWTGNGWRKFSQLPPIRAN